MIGQVSVGNGHVNLCFLKVSGEIQTVLFSFYVFLIKACHPTRVQTSLVVTIVRNDPFSHSAELGPGR